MAKASGSIDLRPVKDASKVADNYLSFTESGGLDVGYTGKTERTNIKVDGMRIYDETDTLVARFLNTGAQIGTDESTHSVIDPYSFMLKDYNSNTFFYASDLRNTYDSSAKVFYATITESFRASSASVSDPHYKVGCVIRSIVKVTVDGTSVDFTKSSSSPYGVNLNTAASYGSVVAITYTTTDVNAKAYTNGIRLSGSNIGPMSFVAGCDNKASGQYAFAEGYLNEAEGANSHAEGNSSSASGVNSHAEGHNTLARGDGAHAEGDDTIVRGAYAHAEGTQTEANAINAHAEGSGSLADGYYSHAQNLGTIAQGKSETVIGEYNVMLNDIINERGDYAFRIGNGTSNTARSDAFRVEWNGNVWHQGDGQYNIASYITTSKGTFVSGYIVVYGKVAQLNFTYKNTSSIAAGQNIYEGTLSKWKPKQAGVGFGYYGSHSIGLIINADGKIIIRNASSSAVTASSNGFCSVTYIMA